MIQQKTLLVGTDFSGLGSPEQALKRLGVNHKVLFACDKDKYAKQSYLANHETEIFYDDITTRNQSETPYVDLYCFGFPCQAFSLAGNRKGFEDTRGTLFFNSLQYIKEKQPRVFIAENVKGLLSHDKVKGSKSKYGRTFGVIRDSLGKTVNGQHNLYAYEDCVNYHLFYIVLNSKHYGIPQNRERVFLIGFKNDNDQKYFKFPSKIILNKKLRDLLQKDVDQKYFISDLALDRIIRKGYSLPKVNPDITGTINTKNNSGQLSIDSGTTLIISDRGSNGEYIVTKDVIGALSSRSGCSHDNHIISLGYINQDTQASQIYDTSGIFPSICAGTHGYALSYISDGILPLYGTEKNSQAERIYSENGLAITQSAQGGGMGSKTGLYNIRGFIRRLTPLEVFRLMGFDDDFFYKCRELHSDTQLYKQGGNSIVVDTIMCLLTEVLKSINYL